ncbi:hypothetical protein D8I35_11965 [Corticibacter populi]|uniref:SMP-30/Gluconolactonase/LRE-like region domain-containing protein n=1 Tax=Corticibacter populi TaxID=1550736 RepID=A0A3M6QTR4_9BURK|nr:hypothetical protein [Corticibacter populi]RMX05862.1 hypothetical protein D8I35_11965 [Corticibacter populi]RZS30820.1 hypothetical protein EV687_3014 [Corticibacter populi]
MKGKKLFAWLLAALPLLATADQRIVLEDVGFAFPESVIHDAQRDVYLVSNVNGRAIDVDDNGFISRISPEGRVIDLKWIDGQRDGITLHAPKGLAIVGNVLYVADHGDAEGNVVRLFDLDSGAPVGEVKIPRSYFLNSLAALPSGDVLVTDSAWQLTLTTDDATQPLAPGARRHHDQSTWSPTGQDAIYRIGPDRKVSVFARSPELAQPNGIRLLESGNLLVGSSSASHVYELDPSGKKISVRYFPARGFDGVGKTPDGRILASGGGKLNVLWPGGKVDTHPGIDSHVTDLNFDLTRGRLLLPQGPANALVIEPLPAKADQ